jgi:hypothetical protein
MEAIGDRSFGEPDATGGEVESDGGPVDTTEGGGSSVIQTFEENSDETTLFDGFVDVEAGGGDVFDHPLFDRAGLSLSLGDYDDGPAGLDKDLFEFRECVFGESAE